MKIAPREQFILTVVGSVVLILIMVALLVYPSFQKLGKLDSQITQAQADVSTAKSLLAQRQAIKDRSSQTDATWLTLANQVPDNPDLPALIIELQDAAFDSGVQLVAVSPAAPTNKVTYVSVPMQIEILGTWADTVDYLQRLAKLSRALRILQVTSGVSDNATVAARATAELPDYFEQSTLSLEAYMIPASTGTTAAAPAAPAPAGP
jgi:Tfp pilus assembly protein PilO